jgi:hypothetical protein
LLFAINRYSTRRGAGRGAASDALPPAGVAAGFGAAERLTCLAACCAALGEGVGFAERVSGCVGLADGVGCTGLGEGAGFTGRVTGCVGLGLVGLTNLAGSLSGSFVTGRNLSNVSVLPGFASGLLFTAGL